MEISSLGKCGKAADLCNPNPWVSGQAQRVKSDSGWLIRDWPGLSWFILAAAILTNLEPPEGGHTRCGDPDIFGVRE